jgi:hypothetical protein
VAKCRHQVLKQEWVLKVAHQLEVAEKKKFLCSHKQQQVEIWKQQLNWA